MNLQSLVLCSEEKIVRVLRRVLNDLEITVEHCDDPELAVQKLSRRRFEAIVVDCDDTEMASLILKAARNAPSNKRAVAVAIVGESGDVRCAFEMGAHFVLYKPISAERARASFRAARALMKCERRRAGRIPMEMPVMYRFNGRSSTLERTVSSDLSEDGIGVRLARRNHERGPMHLQFKLPSSNHLIEAEGELAWENPNGQAGIRFIELPPQTRQALKTWLRENAPDLDEDPPVSCKLTDLSLGGCYLETTSPFPVRARVELKMRVAKLEVQAAGVVKVMHPDVGMGVVFVQRTPEQRERVEKFIHALMETQGAVPELLVEPDGLEPFSASTTPHNNSDLDDPLLNLFQSKAYLPTMEFLRQLRAQRRSEAVDAAQSTLPA